MNLFKKPSPAHGGALAKGRRKTARPLATKMPIHLVLKSHRATGDWSLLRRQNARKVEGVVHSFARKFGVRVYELVNVGNHVHLVVKASHRRGFQNFLRTICARIAIEVTGATKGKPVGGFWKCLAFTRVIRWGRDFRQTREYLTKNRFEGEGIELVTPNGVRLFRIRDGSLEILTASS